jgi:hypothetical protein
MADAPPLIIPAELDDADLTVYAFRLLCHLARRGAGQQGAWGSTEGMAAKLRIDPKTIKKALRELIEKGWITRTARPGLTSLYTLATQPTRAPRPPDGPGYQTAQGVGHQTAQGVGHQTAHEGVTRRSYKKESPQSPPEGVNSPADLTLVPPLNGSGAPQTLETAKKEKGGADDEGAIHDVPGALAALVPLLVALERDPRQRLTRREEDDLLPILRSEPGLRLSDVAAVASAVGQRRACPFNQLPDESPLRGVKQRLDTLLEDWPNQCAIAAKVAGPAAAKKRNPSAEPDYPWQACCWHLYEDEPVPYGQQTPRDRRRYRQMWDSWTESQRQTALDRYQNRITTPIESQLTPA